MENNELKLTDPELGILFYVLNQITGYDDNTLADEMNLFEIDKSVLKTVFDKVDKLKNF
jgi:hypothetical protein